MASWRRNMHSLSDLSRHLCDVCFYYYGQKLSPKIMLYPIRFISVDQQHIRVKFLKSNLLYFRCWLRQLNR